MLSSSPNYTYRAEEKRVDDALSGEEIPMDGEFFQI